MVSTGCQLCLLWHSNEQDSLVLEQHSPDKLLLTKRRKLHIPVHVTVRIKHRVIKEAHIFNVSRCWCGLPAWTYFLIFLQYLLLYDWLVLFRLNAFLTLFHSLPSLNLLGIALGHKISRKSCDILSVSAQCVWKAYPHLREEPEKWYCAFINWTVCH